MKINYISLNIKKYIGDIIILSVLVTRSDFLIFKKI